MALYDLFSKRQKRQTVQPSDVFIYDSIPAEFRAQVIHIWDEALGNDFHHFDHRERSVLFEEMHRLLCKEYGCFVLTGGQDDSAEDRLRKFLMECETDRALDVIELTFRFIGVHGRNSNYTIWTKPRTKPDDAIQELNQRFLEHNLGYQFEQGEIVKVDSKYTHQEIIKPALFLLSDRMYEGADDEFRKAHEHYRHGRAKEALNDALKAFESAMKAICAKRKWGPLTGKETAKDLLKVCGENGLFPAFLESHYSAVRSTLESGVPTIRNKQGGHGQGVQVVEVPQHFAAYALNLTASAIRFLVDSEKAMP